MTAPPIDESLELARFLALEAPYLLRGLPSGVDDLELEETLLLRLERLTGVSGGGAGLEIYPGLDAKGATGHYREGVATLLRGFFRRRALRRSITREERLELLRTMLLTRAVDDALKAAFDAKSIRWGDHPSPQKGFRSTGQEAIVGAGLRLRRPPVWAPGPGYRGDVIAPLIRDLGALLMFLPDPLHPMLVQYGKTGTPVGGRDLHTGDLEHGVLPPAAPLAIAIQTLVGIAWSFKVRAEDRVAVGFIGDGGASLGEWHESVNFAAVKALPVVFVVQNNRWALGTHVSEQSAASRFALRGAGYGIPAATVDGNDPEEVAAAVAWGAERARSGQGPTLLELVTYRRSGHAHHDDDRYHGMPAAGVAGYEYEAERDEWSARDPVEGFRARLLAAGELAAEEIGTLEAEVAAEVERALEEAASAAWPTPEVYRGGVYAPAPAPVEVPIGTPETRRLAYDEAIRQAMAEAMEADPEVFVLGEDVGGRYGGAFGVTRGLAKRFGDDRCVNTPLAESAIVGAAVGAAIMGQRPIVEIQFADFLATGFNALVNNAAKLHWRWGRPVPMVVRLPYGGGTGTAERLLGGGPFHSQCPEMWFVRTPGWKIVAPSTPADAKGLMLAAIRDPNPVLFLEAKGLYGFFRTDLKEEVPLGVEHEVPIGRARVARAGDRVSILTYGAPVWTALAAAEALAGEVETEVVDLRSLWPLDWETIEGSVRKTGRVVLLHEDTLRGGFGGELGARLAEELFWWLDAPLVRVAAPDTPVPYAPPLELDFLPGVDDVVAAVRRVVGA